MRAGTAAAEPGRAGTAAGHLPLVGLTVSELLPRASGPTGREELALAALAGLVSAVQTWHPDQHGPFSRHARSAIRGAVVAALRESAAAGAGLPGPPGGAAAGGASAPAGAPAGGPAARQAALATLRSRLADVLGRDPDVDDLAAALGVPRSEARHGVVEPHRSLVDELTATTGRGEGS